MRQDKDKKERVAMRGYCSPRVPRFALKRVSLLFVVFVFGAFGGAHGENSVQLTAQSDAVADVHSRGMKDGVSMSRRGDAGEISASSSHEDKDNLTTPNRFSLTEKVIPLGAEKVGYTDENEDASAAEFSSLYENPLPEGRMGSNEMVISERAAASSDDEESIEALMTSTFEDDASTSVETEAGEEGDGGKDEISEDSTFLPISDEEKLVGNDLDDDDPALTIGNDGEDGNGVPNLGISTQKHGVLDHDEHLKPPSSVESPNAVARHSKNFAIEGEEFNPEIYFDGEDRAEVLTQLPPDNTFKELSSDESLSASDAERILKSSTLLDEYHVSIYPSDRIPGEVPVPSDSVDQESSFDVDVDNHGNTDADLGIVFDQNDAVSAQQRDSTFDELDGRYTSTIAANSMNESESNDIALLNIDANDFLGTRLTTRVSEVASMGVPFESHALTGTNFNSVGNPKFLSLGHGWSAYGHGMGAQVSQ